MENNYGIVPLQLNVDIHNHTRGSDGRQSTFRTMVRAYQNGINVISFTDHDSVRGYINLEREISTILSIIKDDKLYNVDQFIKLLNNIKIIKGVELITSYEGIVGVEILGYNYDLKKMEKEIEKLKTTVKEKTYVALYKGFNKLIEDLGLVFDKKVLDEAYNQILVEGKGGVVGPFYKELLSHEENKKYLYYTDENGEEKLADSIKLFINKHLYNKKSKLFVDMSTTRPTFKDTIDAIHRAGGIAFLAHAGRYKDK